MRKTWALSVFLLVFIAMLQACVGVSDVESAMQASQLYDEASMTILGVIAWTLAFWLADSGPKQE